MSGNDLWETGDGRVAVYCGNCLEVLKTIGNKVVDSIITDPPYAIANKFGTQNRGRGYGKRRLQFVWDTGKYVGEALGEALGEACGMGGKNASAFVFAGYDTIGVVQDTLRATGYTPKPWAWVKQCPPPPMPNNWWPSGFELAVYGYRPGAWFGDTNPKRRNVMIADSLRHGNSEKCGHPTQKPLKVMRHVVASLLPPGGVAIDPFMGSGTTGVACVEAGRMFVGIEQDREYYEMAVRRIKKAYDAYNATMFVEVQ